MQQIRKKLEIDSKNYLQVLEIIKNNGGKSRLIGGVVRDALLDYKASDIDIATDLLPNEVMNIFISLGYKVIPTGIKFGTVSLLYGGEVFEITTLRKDIACDGRRAKVEYSNDFYIDALRRDFTINALSYDPFEELVYDYFSGLEDLENGIVRFIGNPELRIIEDHLRILRFFRFFGRFGKNLDKASIDACIFHKNLLNTLSRERVKAEFDLILNLPNYVDILALMERCSILQEIFSSVVGARLSVGIDALVEAERLVKEFNEENSNKPDVKLKIETKYALLFSSSFFTSSSSLNSLDSLSVKNLLAFKFSRIEARRIYTLLNYLDLEDIDDYFFKKIWLEDDNFVQTFIFLGVMISKESFSRSLILLGSYNIKKPIFPVNGDDLSGLGFDGRELGLELAELKKLWIDSDFQLGKNQLIKLVSSKQNSNSKKSR